MYQSGYLAGLLVGYGSGFHSGYALGFVVGIIVGSVSGSALGFRWPTAALPICARFFRYRNLFVRPLVVPAVVLHFEMTLENLVDGGAVRRLHGANHGVDFFAVGGQRQFVCVVVVEHHAICAVLEQRQPCGFSLVVGDVATVINHAAASYGIKVIVPSTSVMNSTVMPSCAAIARSAVTPFDCRHPAIVSTTTLCECSMKARSYCSQ